MEIEVTKDNFATEVLESDVPVLVDFWADWCMPCKMVAPVLEDMSKEYAGKAKIAKVDVDSQSELAAEHEVVSIPTLVVFSGGKAVDRHIGAAPRDTLVKLLEAHL